MQVLRGFLINRCGGLLLLLLLQLQSAMVYRRVLSDMAAALCRRNVAVGCTLLLLKASWQAVAHALSARLSPPPALCLLTQVRTILTQTDRARQPPSRAVTRPGR
jgi:hypothetical protein